MRRATVLTSAWMLAFVMLATLALAGQSEPNDLETSTTEAGSPLWDEEDVLAYDTIGVVVDFPDPETREDCRDGGWEDFGFRNQGQCIRFVLTGEDSRDEEP